LERSRGVALEFEFCRAVWSGTSEALIAEPDLQHRYLGI
jgi:hypothetical protein